MAKKVQASELKAAKAAARAMLRATYESARAVYGEEDAGRVMREILAEAVTHTVPGTKTKQ